MSRFNSSNGDSFMDTDDQEPQKQLQNVDEEGDPFLAFIDYARSVLCPGDGEEDGCDTNGDGSSTDTGPGWSWIASRILKSCTAYSSGVTAAILLSDLYQAWSEQHRAGAPKKRPEIINQLKKKHKRTKLPSTVTIDSIYDKNFLSLSSVLEAVVVDTFVLPGTNIYMLTLGDFWSSNTIDLYLHRRYYDLVDPQNGILKKGREVFLTGCRLRTAREGCGRPRLLPTEYLVILLDEDQEYDELLIAAHFCSDSFSSISLKEANCGRSYSLYAKVESIKSMDFEAISGTVQRKQITLVDNGTKLEFLLWGEQVLLANLFSVGSMLALDRPFISGSGESAIETSNKVCLEYGSATQLYLVPFILQEEQVFIPSTQNRYYGSRLMSAGDPTQGPRPSQVTLPCDSQGSIDFRSYPFRICRVRLDQVDHVDTTFSHSVCGHVVNKMPSGDIECSFCHCSCDEDIIRIFQLKITLADETAKIFAWCTGLTATELLQISPDEFCELPEEEQFMYPSSLENERFTVALVNSKRKDNGPAQRLTTDTDVVSWEITRALRYE
ncbi:hypothetical protein Tsubulata_042787 [Turnera subulata]|uniref:Cell division control protein 24 OB domain-containing protein n=1 Tax=Turnera subulata TaxID=218843 RepID=A0A9Q0JEC5_9ROSI|nr:hypothetical protein Tsubulata_042787 [Turnera subulata]